MKRALVLALLAIPTSAFAQLPVYPTSAVPQPPTNLDPGSTGSQAPPPAPPPAQAPAAPPVVVVKPDGTVSVPGAAEAAPTGFYVDGGGGNVRPDKEAQEASRAGPVPELHVVRSGDTLWDICFFYFNDPWQWPKVWSYNPQITNPHWIYPGDLVRLLPRGVFVEPKSDKEPEKGNDVAKAPDTVPPPAQKHQVGLRQRAFVENSDLDKSIAIDGSVDEKVLLGKGDSVYLTYPSNNAPQVGQRYSIYVPDNELRARNNGKSVGAYVRIVGSIEVVSVKQDKRARGVITESNKEIERGMKVGKLIKEYKNVPPVPAKVDAQGTIIAMLLGDQLIGQGELVFIDLGQSSGLEVGNRMFVVRRGDAKPPHLGNTVGQDDRRFPARELGELIVVEVDEKMSVGLLTLSQQEMGVGDLVMMQAAK